VVLSKKGSNRVESDQGFSLWLRNPFNLHYFENGRELVIPGEMLTGDKDLLVSVSAIRGWKPPFDQETIDKPRREQIVANVAAALAFLGIRYEFD
jgi:hypothetical protein